MRVPALLPGGMDTYFLRAASSGVQKLARVQIKYKIIRISDQTGFVGNPGWMVKMTKRRRARDIPTSSAKAHPLMLSSPKHKQQKLFCTTRLQTNELQKRRLPAAIQVLLPNHRARNKMFQQTTLQEKLSPSCPPSGLSPRRSLTWFNDNVFG